MLAKLVVRGVALLESINLSLVVHAYQISNSVLLSSTRNHDNIDVDIDIYTNPEDINDDENSNDNDDDEYIIQRHNTEPDLSVMEITNFDTESLHARADDAFDLSSAFGELDFPQHQQHHHQQQQQQHQQQQQQQQQHQQQQHQQQQQQIEELADFLDSDY